MHQAVAATTYGPNSACNSSSKTSNPKLLLRIEKLLQFFSIFENFLQNSWLSQHCKLKKQKSTAFLIRSLWIVCGLWTYPVAHGRSRSNPYNGFEWVHQIRVGFVQPPLILSSEDWVNSLSIKTGLLLEFLPSWEWAKVWESWNYDGNRPCKFCNLYFLKVAKDKKIQTNV